MVAMLRRLLLSFVAANVVAALLDFLMLLAVGLVDPSAVSSASNGAITAYVVLLLVVADLVALPMVAGVACALTLAGIAPPSATDRKAKHSKSLWPTATR